MAISLMTATSSEGSPVSLPPPTPLSPIDPSRPNEMENNSNNDNNNDNGNNTPTTKATAPANATEKRKTSRRANTAERRATHNAVERQRRETLNGRFLDLAALLPNLTSVRRPSKSAIVNSSIALIHAQRRQRATAAREVRTLYSQFLSLKAECDEWRLRNGVPPVEDGERSKEFVALLELREEEEMGEEERGALRLAMSATAHGANGEGGIGGMDDDDDLVVPHLSGSTPTVAHHSEANSDSEQFAHQIAQPTPNPLQIQTAQAQAQAQYHQHQLRVRSATFSHPSFQQGLPSPIHNNTPTTPAGGANHHGHHPYANAYHGGIPRPGSHGGLPHQNGAPHYAGGHHHSASHGVQHGHVLPFDNGSDLILAGESHLSHPHVHAHQHAHHHHNPAHAHAHHHHGGQHFGGSDIFSPTSTTSGPHTPIGLSGPHTPTGLEMLYGPGPVGLPNGGMDFSKPDWANAGGLGMGVGVNIPPTFDDSASTHSSSTNPAEGLNVAGGVHGHSSPRSSSGSSGSSSGGRSRAGSMVNGVEAVNLNAGNGKEAMAGMMMGGGMMGGNVAMSMFF